jgi:hypothetical protein
MQKEVYQFIANQSWEAVLERRDCRRCGTSFPIFLADKEMLDKLSPSIAWTVLPLPFPTICHECRNRKQLVFRNERRLYRRTCDATSKPILSRYAPEYPSKVYDSDYRRSVEWDPKEYGIEYTHGKFLEQLKQLKEVIPKVWLITVNCQNSEYTNHCMNNKNCYIVSLTAEAEHCYYGRYLVNAFKTMDCFDVLDTSHLYDCTRIIKSQTCIHCDDVENSENIYFSHSVKNSQNIIFGFNVLNKKNMIGDDEVSEQAIAEFKEKLKSRDFYEECISKFNELRKQQLIQKSVDNALCTNVIGDSLRYGENLFLCFMMKDENGSKDCRYMFDSVNIMDSMDVYSSGLSWCELLYNSQGSAHSNRSVALAMSIQTAYGYYNEECFHSDHLLGCFGIKNSSYCILNKQYSQEEWERIAVNILHELQKQGTWWDFFDTDLSGFPYNDTMVYDFYPIQRIRILDKETIINPSGHGTVTILEPDKFISDALLALWGKEQIKIRWRTRENEITVPDTMQRIKAVTLPDNIDDVDDSILDKALICEVSGVPFRVIKQELALYRKMWLPLPRLHPEMRHQQRLRRIPPKTLYVRTCDACKKDMLSVHLQGAPYKVYCEACYDHEIYG